MGGSGEVVGEGGFAESSAGGDFGGHVAGFGEAKDGGFDAGKGEVERVAAHFRAGEFDGAGVAVGGEEIEGGSAGIFVAEELADFVVGFAGGVVAGAAEEFVSKIGFAAVEVGVASADDESERREFGFGVFKEDGVDVAFEVVDGDEGDFAGEGEGLGEGDADEEGADEAGALSDGDGVDGDVGLGEGLLDDGDDGAEVFAGGEFGNDAAETLVGIELGGDDGGENLASVGDDGGGRFVTGGFKT